MTATSQSSSSSADLAVYRLESSPGRAAPTTSDTEERDWIEPLLRENAIWFCHLRWIVVTVLLLTGVAGLMPAVPRSIGLDLRPAWPLASGAILAVLNVVFARLSRTPAGGSTRGILWAQIAADVLILTGVIQWLGRDLPAAPFMYLFHIILACIVFPPRQSLWVVGLAAACYATAVLADERGWLPWSSVLVGSISGTRLTPWLSQVVPMLLVWAVIWYLVSRLAATLRRRESELAETNRRLEASSVERANHMLQTTHQLKAPFAAVHALTQLLLGGYSGPLPAAATGVVEKISARCLALSRQIQEMLQLANLRSQSQTAPPRCEVNLAVVAEEVLGRVEPAARQRGIRFSRAIEPTVVIGVQDHVTMLVDNIVVNAVNYSRDDSDVEVACGKDSSGDAHLSVRDHGIGIPRDKLPRIFDDYYRTEEAVQHNRASTGLGLAIVRQVATAAGFCIQVESAPGWGTRFTVTFPRAVLVAPQP